MTFHPAKCYESQGTKAYQATTPELQGDNSETADVNSEPSLFIRISLALVNTEHPG
jgi:hypothetical protein